MNKLLLVSCVLLFLLLGLNVHAQNKVESFKYSLQVETVPSLKMLKAEVTITFPASASRKTSFTLNKNLNINNISRGDKVVLLHAGTEKDAYSEWGLELGSQDNSITIEYNGMIFDDPSDGDSEGFISNDGIVLLGSSNWYPDIMGGLKTFQMSVRHPSDWKMATQGQIISQEILNGTTTTTHSENTPQQDLYLIVGPYFEFSRELPNGKWIRVLLRKDDKDLAQNYLSLLPDYMDHYAKTIAPYPYTHFTIIENYWETGYGMPAFTLLGPTVLRLPFILYSSLPHELLHNYWGNSVYVDYFNGNWSEGLTTYLADHWQQETRAADSEYRMNQLMGYADFVKKETDFALVEFKGRHNESSQAIGYGKGMMFFHMLRKKVGEQKFQEGLKNFYFKNVYQAASYEDIRIAFEEVTGLNLETFFAQWTEKVGAPELKLGSVTPTLWADGTWATSWELSQNANDLYELDVPIRWTLENGKTIQQIVKFKDAAQNFTLVTDSKPVRIEVDPEFDLFRKLVPEERPATFSSVFGAAKTTVYHTANSQELLKMPATWEVVFGSRFDYLEIEDSFILPSEGAVILLGNSRTMREFVRSQANDGNLKISESSISLDGSTYDYSEHSLSLVFRNKNNPGQYIVWVPSALPPVDELAKRITHYGKYSLLAFKGKPNVLKKTLAPANSPLKKKL